MPETRNDKTARLAAPREATTLRWFLSGELPPITAALVVGERFQRATLGAVSQTLNGVVPDALNSHAGDRPAVGHLHPFYLAEDADGDGWIDHVLLHAPLGLAPEWRWALALVRPAAGSAGRLPPFEATPDWIGRSDLNLVPGTLLGRSRVWRSVSPYVPDYHLKAKFRVEDALRRDLERRGLTPLSVQPIQRVLIADTWCGPEVFATTRRDGGKREARSRHGGSFWELRFDLPVRGPLAVGFSCHLGLGLFRRLGSVLGAPKRIEALPTEVEPPTRRGPPAHVDADEDST